MLLSDSAPTFECATLLNELRLCQHGVAQNLLKYSKPHHAHVKTRELRQCNHDCLKEFAMDDFLVL